MKMIIPKIGQIYKASNILDKNPSFSKIKFKITYIFHEEIIHHPVIHALVLEKCETSTFKVGVCYKWNLNFNTNQFNLVQKSKLPSWF